MNSSHLTQLLFLGAEDLFRAELLKKPQPRMSIRDRHIFEIFAARIRECFSSAQVWGFGSRSRGDATRESDLDICVVVEGHIHEDRHIIRRIGWEVGFEHDRLICTVFSGKDAQNDQ
jgi:uncharacterized protein